MKLQVIRHFGQRSDWKRSLFRLPFSVTRASGIGAALAGLFVMTTIPAAQTVVVGTGNPNLDVPAVQAAVDQGGRVVLKGSFSFDVPPIDGRTIQVTKAVIISGVKEKSGAMTTIVGGKCPFRINAPGLVVTIQGLRFVSPESIAVVIVAVAGLRIANCKIERVRLTVRSGVPTGAAGIGTTIPTPGAPREVVGKLSILDNEIDIGGNAATRTVGILINPMGRADKPAEVRISGNTVRNITAHGIDVRDIVGRATIERNEIITGAVGGQQGGEAGNRDVFVDGIRILGSGKYLVAHNSIDCAFENAAGIRLQSNSPTVPLTEAVVEKNKIRMALPDGVTPGGQSAGIELRRFCVGNRVMNNQILGRGRAAIALVSETTPVDREVFLTPSDNILVKNQHKHFVHSQAEVFVGERVTNTAIVEEKRTILIEAQTRRPSEAKEAVWRPKG